MGWDCTWLKKLLPDWVEKLNLHSATDSGTTIEVNLPVRQMAENLNYNELFRTLLINTSISFLQIKSQCSGQVLLGESGQEGGEGAGLTRGGGGQRDCLNLFLKGCQWRCQAKGW